MYVNPSIQDKFNSLSDTLKGRIEAEGKDLYNIYDMIQILEKIVADDEKATL